MEAAEPQGARGEPLLSRVQPAGRWLHRRGRVLRAAAGVNVSTAHVVTVSTSHSWKTEPAIAQHLGFSVQYQITTFSGVGFYST